MPGKQDRGQQKLGNHNYLNISTDNAEACVLTHHTNSSPDSSFLDPPALCATAATYALARLRAPAAEMPWSWSDPPGE
jgi:hypothetical protein